MKSLRIVIVVIFSFVCGGLNAAVPLKKELHAGWKFKQARLTNWYPATVPGVVHTDLLDNGIIEDPFYRLNERGLQWIDKEDWIYETLITITPDIVARENIRLVFEGLDTYADVYVNEEKVLSTDNMFRQWSVDVKSFLKPGENQLRVFFHSPVKVDVPKWDALPYQYEAGNDQSENGGLLNKRISVFARKAGYHYGWDWGPRLLTSGIWRPVYLEAWSDVRIENIFVRQKNVTAARAEITQEVEIEADKALEGVVITVTDRTTGKLLGSKITDLAAGVNKVAIDFSMKKPKLWWSNGLGDPHLYTFRTDVLLGQDIVDSKDERIGIRSIRVINKPDGDGKTFYFELNGKPVFAKGANYIPQDNFMPRVTEDDYRRTILDAVNANMNMLRIWGGGIYENKIFYDLCDELGIMVWQDFMFACSLYPASGELLENIRLEAIDNVRRLRNHASIAIWCGNNECLDAWYNWGYKRKYEALNPDYARKIWSELYDQYFVTLPAVVEEYAPEAFYWPSSPFAHVERGSDGKNGDMHYWGVWHAKKPITSYNTTRSRFFSEYGFQSFPEFESVKRYAPLPEDWEITSEVMMSHQRGGDHANKLIESYLLSEYREPRNFESFLYMNQVLQGDAIKAAIEAHRRDMPYCMGTLFWQHNDCWPVASWSSRDYYGRWKAQHYFAREAFRDLLVSPVKEKDMLNIYVVSDRQKNADGVLEVKLLDLVSGKELNSHQDSIKIKANTSARVWNVELDRFLNSIAPADVVVHAKLTVGQEVYTNNYFLVKQKEINYLKAVIKHAIDPVTGGYEVSLTSDVFARAVFMSVDGIDNFFVDNYFDILPGETVTRYVRTSLLQREFEEQLKIVSLSDGY